MFIAINRKNRNDYHSFTWTANSKLCINGVEVDEKNWEIVDVKIVTSQDKKPKLEPKLLINIFIDGTWDTSHEDKSDLSPVRIFDKGTQVQILASQYDQYIDNLEDRGFDCYLCPEMYSHPQWNGEIIFMTDAE